MKKKTDFSTAEMFDVSVAPNQTIMKKNAKKRETSRNPSAIEPQEYVDKEKVCPYCKSINNCKYKYVNNSSFDQPRYQCLKEDCKKLFPLVPHNRPIGRTYSKKRGEDPIELQGLTKICSHCGAINNASFKYYNNDKLKQGLQPRFQCLNDKCKKQFQMRKMINDDGSITLVNTSRQQSFTSLLTSDENPMQCYNGFGGGMLPTHNYPMYDASTSLDANEQQMRQDYNEFGGTLPAYDNHMYDVDIAPDANTLTEDYLNPEMEVQVSEEDSDELYNQESLVETTQDYHGNGNPSMSTLRGFHPNGGNFQNGGFEDEIVQEPRVETIHDYHTEGNPSMVRNDMVPNGDIYQNGASQLKINQESLHDETIQNNNLKEDNPSIPWDEAFLNGDNSRNESKSTEFYSKLSWAFIEPPEDFCFSASILLDGGDYH